MSTTFLQLGGLFHLALFVFHAFFWKLFRWKADLRSLSVINRRVMPVMNLCLMAIFLGIAFLSFGYTDELLQPGLGQSVLLLISLLWFFRAILQVVYFGLAKVASLSLFLVFLVGALLYAVPFFAG